MLKQGIGRMVLALSLALLLPVFIPSPSMVASLAALPEQKIVSFSTAIDTSSEDIQITQDLHGNISIQGQTYHADLDSTRFMFYPDAPENLAAVNAVGFRLLSIHHGEMALFDAMQGPVSASPERRGTHISYLRPWDIEERYAIAADSVEQLFILNTPLPGSGDLRITGSFETALTPSMNEPQGGISFWRDGIQVASYSQAIVYDVTGKALVADMELSESQISFVISATWLAEAVFPVTIDPVFGSAIDISVYTDSQQRPWTAHNTADNEYLVVWKDAGHYATRGFDVWGQIVYANGTLKGPNFQIGTSGEDGRWQTDPRVAYNPHDNQYLVVWLDDRNSDIWTNPHVYGQRVSAAGALVGSNFAISTASGNKGGPDVVYNSGSQTYLVAWADYRNGGDGDIYGQRISRTGGLTGSAIQIHTFGSSPAIAYSVTDNRNLIMWEQSGNVYGKLVTAAGSVGSLLTISNASGTQNGGDIAWNSVANEFLAVWDDERNGGSGTTDIYAQRLSNAGAALGTATSANLAISTGSDVQWWPRVAYDSAADKYLVVWNDYRNGATTTNDIYAQVVSGSGTLVGSNYVITNQSNGEVTANVAAGNGQYLVSWERESTSGSDIIGRRVDEAPPTNPTSFSATPAKNTWTSDNTVAISWSGASDAGSGINGYSFEWSTSSTTVPDKTVDTTGTSTTSSALADGASWYFHVRTRDNAGNWNSSAAHYGPFKIDTTAPTNPTTFSATPVKDVWTSDNTVAISWSGASDAGSGINGYSFSWTTSSTTVPDTTADTTGTSTTSSALADGASWYFHIRTRDSVGIWSSGAAHYGPFKIDTTAPTNPTTFSATPGMNIWTSDNTVAISWSGASDAGSGINGYSFSWTTSSTTVPDTTVDTTGTSTTSSALADGASWYFHVRTRDNAGNWNSSAAHYGPFKIDTTAPTNPTTFSATPGMNIWTSDNTVAISWSGASDAGSGINGYSFSWTTSSTTVPDTTVDTTGTSTTSSALADGASWYFHVRTRDSVGIWNSSAAHYGPFKIDTTAPTNPTTFSATPVKDVWTSDNTVAISWSGASGTGSDPNGYSFEWTTSSTTVPDTTVDMTGTSTTSSALADGASWYFHIRTRDSVGIWSSGAAHYGPFKIDTTAPTNPTVPANPGCTATHDVWQKTCNDPNFTWGGASDTHSGVAGYDVYWGDSSTGTPTTWTPTAVYDPPPVTSGTYYLRVKTTDDVGNESAVITLFTLKYDAIAPTNPTSVNPGCTATSDIWQNTCSDANFTWSGADDTPSGVAGYYYYWGTSSSGDPIVWTTGAGYDPTPIESGTPYYLRVRTQDLAGNISAAVTLFVLKYDTTAPTNPTSVNPGCTATNNVWQNTCNDPNFTWSGANDAHSGVAGYYYYWGPSSAGDPVTWTATPSFNPPAISSGCYYLRVRTQDGAGNISPPITIIIICYDGIAPTNPPVPANPVCTATHDVWQNTCADPNFTWSGGSDAHSGIKGYYYYWGTSSSGDPTTWTATAGYNPGAIASGTTYYLRVKTEDNAGNVSAAATTLFILKYDATAPTNPTAATPGCTATSDVWQNTCSDANFTWSGASDAHSGVKGYYVYWGTSSAGDPVTWTPAAAYNPGAIASGTTYYLRVKTEDNAGNVSAATTLFILKYDATAPINPTSVNPGCTATSDVWQNTCSDANFTWSGASDAHSGVKGYYVYWGTSSTGDPATWTTTATYNPSAIPSGTPLYLRVKTQDNVGNTSNPTTLFILKYDGTLPLSGSSSPAYANGASVTVVWTASDAASGVAATRLWVKFGSGGTWSATTLVQTGTSGMFNYAPTSGNGAYYFATVATDNAGNVEASPVDAGDTGTIYDTVTPFAIANAPANVSSPPVPIIWIANDATAGVASTRLWVKFENTGAWNGTSLVQTGSSGTFNYTPAEGNGTYYFAAVATDNAGNVGALPTGAGDTQTLYTGDLPDPPPAPVLGPIHNPDLVETYTVSWSNVSEVLGYILEEATVATFNDATVVYTGSDLSTVIQGKMTGTYYYRVKSVAAHADSIWSNTQSVQVVITHILSVQQVGQGTIAQTPEGTTFNHGTVVTLTATPVTGWHFAGWSGACSGSGVCSIILDADKMVTATFSINTHTLAVNQIGAGNISQLPTGTTFDYGTVITLTATPATGWHFAGWSGGCSGSDVCTVLMDANRAITATFTINTYNLTVNQIGAGLVTQMPEGNTLDYGTVVTLTATPVVGWSLAGWSGDCNGNGTCSLLIDADKAVTATFTINQYTLAVSKIGAGVVTQTPEGDTFDYGTVITLTATPATGWHFVGWSGTCSGSGDCIVLVDADKAVTATFAINTHTLSVGQVGAGIITQTPEGTTFDYGTVITLTATPATGWGFVGWSGACSGSGVCSVTMDADKTVAATFSINTHTLTVTQVGEGVITQMPAGATFNYGTVVTLTATPETGWSFAGWSGACSGSGACNVVMDADKAATATFSINQHTLAVVQAGAGSITQMPEGTVFEYGTVVTLMAMPATGWSFTGWSGACGGNGICLVTLDADKTVTATFTINTYTLRVGQSGVGVIGQTPEGAVFDYGTVITLTATPATGWSFAGWSGACSGSADCCVTMDAHKTVTATFSINQHTLTVEQVGMGTINQTPAGTIFDYGTVITLTATPATGWGFAGWSGTCSGSGACSVVMNADKTVTATFSINQHTLTIARAGNGNGIIAPTIGDYTYDYGTVVALTAIANTGSTFAEWSGNPDCADGVVTMNADKTCTAIFTLDTYTLTMAQEGTGSGLITPDVGQHTYDYGTMVTLTAVPDPGSTLAGWDGELDCADGVATMDANKACTATFTLNTYTLTVNQVGEGALNQRPPGATLDYGTVVTLTATPETDWSFVGWSGACGGMTFTCTVVMEADKVLTATFAVNIPDAPGTLIATAISTSQIDLIWIDNSNTEAGFEIERSLTGTGSWTQVAVVGADITAYSNTGLPCGSVYYYRVRAVNVSGASLWSNTASASTVICTPTLDPISNTDGNGSYDIYWSNVGEATSYTLQEATDSDFIGATAVYSGSNTSTTISDRSPGVYYYRARASNAVADSPWSNIVSATVVQPGTGEVYEPDDTCAQARVILTDGTVQERTFHQQADADWVVFTATAGVEYRIEAQVPPGSPADVTLELYGQCAGLPLESQNYAFAAGVRLDFESPTSGILYLRWTNNEAAVYGAEVVYHISVRALATEPTPGALIIVAGKLKPNDQLQPNIHYVANQVYQLFQTQGYDPARIYYLATDLSLPGVDALATTANLQAALTTWAVDKVGSDRALTLYLVDHGLLNQLYLDKPAGQWVTPEQIDTWLTQLETACPGVKVNVIIEACHAGSFIHLPQTVSRSGRVVIASTGAYNSAYASPQGAVFSDYFGAALGQGESLYAAFQTARWATLAVRSMQTPWLDANGNGIPNEPADGELAAVRGFAYAGTLSGEQWPPYVVTAIGPSVIIQRQGVIRAEVRDDEQVRRVWAVIYPPSYTPPQTGEELVSEVLPTIVLAAQGNGQYAATYTDFAEMGAYRVVVYAEDNGGREARPVAIEVQTGWAVYLPLVIRQ